MIFFYQILYEQSEKLLSSIINHQIDEQFEASLAIMLLHSSSFFRSPSLSSMAAASESKPRKGDVVSVIRERSVTCSESKSSNRDITSVIRGKECDLLWEQI